MHILVIFLITGLNQKSSVHALPNLILWTQGSHFMAMDPPKVQNKFGPGNITFAGFCLFQLQRCCDGSDWKIFSKKQKHAAVKVIFSSCKSLQCSGSSTMQISSHPFISIFPFDNNPIHLIFLFKLHWIFETEEGNIYIFIKYLP